jgi:hypothetical protein
VPTEECRPILSPATSTVYLLGRHTMNDWRNIRGYEGHYQVSSTGQVRSLKRGGRLMSPAVSRTGYYQVNLYLEGRVKHFYVHRLVAAAFIKPIPEGMEVNHKDGDKSNNDVDNLEIVTAEENLRHARETGLMPSGGERSPVAKLTEEEVGEIREAKVRGERAALVAARFGVCERTIYGIWERKTWRQVA